jgi:succinate dehydrogenase / fumarate reductase membrane anchor subunit
MRSSTSVRPRGAFEYGMWWFTRLSGLALILFAAASMGAGFVLGGRTQLDMPAMFRWIFFPNPNHVINSDIPDVGQGWSNTFWQVYSTVMIFLASVHGINGLRMVIEDYITRPLLVKMLRGVLFVLWLGGMVVAIFVILAS